MVMVTAKYTVRSAIAGCTKAIASFLDQNIKAKCSFKLENLSEDITKKDLIIMFDTEVDRNAFRMQSTPAK